MRRYGRAEDEMPLPGACMRPMLDLLDDDQTGINKKKDEHAVIGVKETYRGVVELLGVGGMEDRN